MTAHDIIKKWPSVPAFAEDIGAKIKAARMMAFRKSIPVEYWPAMIEGAKARGLNDITYEALVQAHASKSTEAA